jgi:tetratricopeptide (TPR) repeat protein
LAQVHGQDALAHAEAQGDLLAKASRLAESGELGDAWALVDSALKEDPDNLRALICATHIHYRGNKYTTAYQFARRAAGFAPKNPYCWGNLANIEHELYRFEQAEFCIKKGLEVANKREQYAFLRKIQASLFVQMGDWERAVRAGRIAVALQDSPKNRANLGMALLGMGQWEEAWPMYDEIIGRDRSVKKMQYASEPVWDGARGKSIVIYDEQGVGDSISFASIVPDALKDAEVVLDVRPYLAGLFRRSFPEATVYGSFSGEGEEEEYGIGEDWRPKHQIDASISIGGLAKLYRPKPESCPGTPYLKADPVRVAKWKEQFAKEGKPVLGVAWTGGLEHTGAKHRKWSLEELLPFFRSVDAVWVSLQYKDAAKEIAEFKVKYPDIDIRQYPDTLTDDYDDTAALVDALDMVVSMQTAVIHLAGALGKECWCFVNKHSQWRYGPNTQTTLPWYRSVRLFRNVDGWPIAKAAQELRLKYGAR